MPTVAEMTELQSECTWIWVIQNGVNGYKVVGKNGNSIFLPATGAIFEGSAINGAGENGVYWSSSLNVVGDAWADGPSYAYEIAFVSDNVVINLGSRNKGQVVRPVCP